jgi:hypothetical protein
VWPGGRRFHPWILALPCPPLQIIVAGWQAGWQGRRASRLEAPSGMYMYLLYVCTVLEAKQPFAECAEVLPHKGLKEYREVLGIIEAPSIFRESRGWAWARPRPGPSPSQHAPQLDSTSYRWRSTPLRTEKTKQNSGMIFMGLARAPANLARTKLRTS